MPRETQETITQWIEETFGAAGSNARVVARANEEMAEMVRSVTIDDAHADLAEEVDKKMVVNRARTWKLDGSGCGYHT